MENMMKRVAEGDKMAFDKLFFMYYPKILNYLSHFISSKEQSEDMAQDFFINLWRNRHFLETVKNPDGVCKGVREITLDGQPLCGNIVPCTPGEHKVTVILG